MRDGRRPRRGASLPARLRDGVGTLLERARRAMMAQLRRGREAMPQPMPTLAIQAAERLLGASERLTGWQGVLRWGEGVPALDHLTEWRWLEPSGAFAFAQAIADRYRVLPPPWLALTLPLAQRFGPAGARRARVRRQDVLQPVPTSSEVAGEAAAGYPASLAARPKPAEAPSQREATAPPLGPQAAGQVKPAARPRLGMMKEAIGRLALEGVPFPLRRLFRLPRVARATRREAEPPVEEGRPRRLPLLRPPVPAVPSAPAKGAEPEPPVEEGRPRRLPLLRLPASAAPSTPAEGAELEPPPPRPRLRGSLPALDLVEPLIPGMESTASRPGSARGKAIRARGTEAAAEGREAPPRRRAAFRPLTRRGLEGPSALKRTPEIGLPLLREGPERPFPPLRAGIPEEVAIETEPERAEPPREALTTESPRPPGPPKGARRPLAGAVIERGRQGRLLGARLRRPFGMGARPLPRPLLLFSESPEEGEEMGPMGLGPGRPLPWRPRRAMERFFAEDFGGVRIHFEPMVSRIAETLGAEAFTVGERIFFRGGRARFATPRGLALLGHELAHVRQRRRAPAVATPSTLRAEAEEKEASSSELVLRQILEARRIEFPWPESPALDLKSLPQASTEAGRPPTRPPRLRGSAPEMALARAPAERPAATEAPAPAAPSPAGEAPAREGAKEPDLEALAEEVYSLILRRLAVEREMLGRHW